ncbi:pectate lyase, partial [Sarracenia purpurea var. burkii]
EWRRWNWRSEGDLMLNGTFFTSTSARASSDYAKASSFGARSSFLVSSITSGASTFSCRKSSCC